MATELADVQLALRSQKRSVVRVTLASIYANLIFYLCQDASALSESLTCEICTLKLWSPFMSVSRISLIRFLTTASQLT